MCEGRRAVRTDGGGHGAVRIRSKHGWMGQRRFLRWMATAGGGQQQQPAGSRRGGGWRRRHAWRACSGWRCCWHRLHEIESNMQDPRGHQRHQRGDGSTRLGGRNRRGPDGVVSMTDSGSMMDSVRRLVRLQFPAHAAAVAAVAARGAWGLSALGGTPPQRTEPQTDHTYSS